MEMEDSRLDELLAKHPMLFHGKQPEQPSFLYAGWFSLLDRACDELESTLTPQQKAKFELLQVKEKFAQLRVYCRWPGMTVNEARAPLNRAEAESLHICQMCGKSGRQRETRHGVIVTRCDRHSPPGSNG